MGTIKEYIKIVKTFLKRVYPNYMIFMVFLGISTFFWLLNALGKQYEKEIPITIEFTNIPSGYQIVQNVEEKVLTKVYGSGYSLFRYLSLRQYFPVEVDVSEYYKDSSARYFKFEIDSKEKIQESIYGDFEIKRLSVTNIKRTISILDTIKVPVKAFVDISVDTDHDFVDGYTIEPDSITLVGPKLILDTVKFVQTEDIINKDVSSTISSSYKLLPLEKIEFSTEKVHFEAKVDEIEEYDVTIPITLKNFPRSFTKKHESLEVEVEYKTIESFEDVELDKVITAEANYYNRNKENNTVEIKIYGMPKRFDINALDPAVIEIEE